MHVRVCVCVSTGTIHPLHLFFIDCCQARFEDVGGGGVVVDLSYKYDHKLFRR